MCWTNREFHIRCVREGLPRKNCSTFGLKKKEFKVQIIGILQEKDSFYWTKMHLWKGGEKFGQGPPPPPHLDKIQKKSSFLSGDLPLWLDRSQHFTLPLAPNIVPSSYTQRHQNKSISTPHKWLSIDRRVERMPVLYYVNQFHAASMQPTGGADRWGFSFF